MGGDSITIYKITNVINSKVYIGKCHNSVKARFKRHIKESENYTLDTHFARAIREYGKENFIYEIIDKAKSPEELIEKEKYWIAYYKSNNELYGYNCSDGGEGGNTYQNKTEEELNLIKNKIRETKLGSKNPQARKVKCKNIISEEEFHFDTVKDMCIFFKETQHNFITRRCTHKTKCLYKREWLISYEDEEYDLTCTVNKNNRKARSVKIINLSNNEEKIFNSYAEAERYYKLTPKILSKKTYKQGDSYIIKNLKVVILK